MPRLVVAAQQSRDTYSYTDVPGDDSTMTTYIENALAAQETGTAVPFATIDRQRDAVVGTTRFGNIEYWTWPAGSSHQRGLELPDVVEIGWTWLAPDAQRTGINTEAKLLMLTHALEGWRVHAVRFRTDARNAKSRAAIERLGAHLDGVVRADKVAYDGSLRDTAVYSIRDHEWRELKDRLKARLR
jgi:N-acetyltransferase